MTMRTISLSVAFLLFVLSVGCGKKDSAAPMTKETKKDSTVTPTLPTSATNDGADSLKAATDFLKSVQDGKATSANLTDAFKKAIAPAELEADKAAGYAESGVTAWLSTAKTKATADAFRVDYASADYLIASAGTYKPGKSYVRLIKTENTWSVDSAIFGSTAYNAPLIGSSQAAVEYTTIAFAEAILDKRFSEVEALLSKSAKEKLAPPLFDSDKEQGFSRSKLQSVFADLLAAKIESSGLSVTGTNGTFEITLAGTRKTLRFKLTPGQSPGSFLIDDFQLK